MLCFFVFVMMFVMIFVTGPPVPAVRPLGAFLPRSLGSPASSFVVTVLQVRYMDGSYTEGGQFFDRIPAEMRPEFGPTGPPVLFQVSLATFVLMGALSPAFIAHYNAPKYHWQLKDRSAKRFNAAVAVAFSLAFILFGWMMVVGYLSFEKYCSGNILNSSGTTASAASCWPRSRIRRRRQCRNSQHLELGLVVLRILTRRPGDSSRARSISVSATHGPSPG